MITGQQAQELWELIEDIKVGMLVTNDEGTLRSRPMHITQDKFDGKLWFFTNSHEGKADEISKNPNINLNFADIGDEAYISISGKAKITKDKDLIDKFWNPFVGAWFPEGKESDNVALIEIIVEQAESWDTDKNKMLQLFEIIKANVTDTEPDMGKNKKYG